MPGTPARPELVAWLRERHPEAPDFGPEDDLIEMRLVDSLGFLEFLQLIERLSGRAVDVETLDVDTFRTLSRIEQVYFTPARTP